MFELAAFIHAVGSAADVEQVAALVADACQEPQAVAAAVAEVDAGLVIHRSSSLTVLNVAIPPGFRTAPHDHCMWAVVGIYEGQEENQFYTLGEDGPTPERAISVQAPEVLVLDGAEVHAIANQLDVFTRGLHVYGGDLLAAERSIWDPETGERLPYEEDTARALSRRLMRSA